MEKVPKKLSKLVWLQELLIGEIFTSLNTESSFMRLHRTAIHPADGSCLCVPTRSVRRASGFVLVAISETDFSKTSSCKRSGYDSS
jgi:hypothetical protein